MQCFVASIREYKRSNLFDTDPFGEAISAKGNEIIIMIRMANGYIIFFAKAKSMLSVACKLLAKNRE